MTERPTDKVNYILDAHIGIGNTKQLYLEKQLRKLHSLIALRTDKVNYKVALLLKTR